MALWLRPVLATTILLTSVLIVPAAPRTWTDSTGRFTIEAELVEVRDGNAHLKKASGQVVAMPVDKLSTADREYLKGLSSGSPAPATVPATATEDLIELLSGAETEGKVTARDETTVSIEVEMNGRTFLRKYPLSRIHAVTVNGRREVINGTDGAEDSPQRSDTPGSSAAGRTRAEIEKLIDQSGRTPPEWFDSVRVNYPNTLDLSYPARPPGPWNESRNVDQYVWGRINPNPGRWHEGIRFMHHLLVMHEKDVGKRTRAMRQLGRMYYDFEQDYARAAFWFLRAGLGPDNPSPQAVKLASCYWELGSKAMAVELLSRLPIYPSSIKLWADMGDTDKALEAAEALAQAGWPHVAYIAAGDACRIEGRYGPAEEYYRKVLAVPASGRGHKLILRCHQRARASIDGIRIFDALDLSRVADGTYAGSAPGYAGDLHVRVVVRGGRIESVAVTQHKEKQFFSSLTDTPRRIVEQQGLKGVDAVTGATITSEAIINAVARALAEKPD